MFITKRHRSSSITSQIAPGTSELWPLTQKKKEFGFRSITLIVFIRISPNFQKMFLTKRHRSSSITSQIAPGTSELWPILNSLYSILRDNKRKDGVLIFFFCKSFSYMIIPFYSIDHFRYLAQYAIAICFQQKHSKYNCLVELHRDNKL